MAILMTDENEMNRAMVIGKIEFLPMNPRTDDTPTIRQISRAALEKYSTDKRAQKSCGITPSVVTIALCEVCVKQSRLKHSTMCAGCLENKETKNLPGNFSEREIIVRAFLLMTLLVGLLILAVVKFAAPRVEKTAVPSLPSIANAR